MSTVRVSKKDVDERQSREVPGWLVEKENYTILSLHEVQAKGLWVPADKARERIG